MVIPSVLTLASAASAATYYVAANGSDSNSGTSKSTPWLHAPGMTSCTANCASVSPRPGDRFIFRGGDVWSASSFEMQISNRNGTPTNPIYFGVDETWHSGTSWARPVFDGSGGSLSNLVSISYSSYVTLDNIELKGFTASGKFGPATINLYCDNHIVMEHLYVHDWALSASVATDGAHGGIVANDPRCNADGNVITYSVISNAELTGVRQNGVGVRAVDVDHSVIHDVSTAQLFGRIHDSVVYNVSYPSGNKSFDPMYHTNVTYLEWGDGSQHTDGLGLYAYNNVIHDIEAGSGGIYPAFCGTFHIFNNVVYNNYATGDSDIQIDPNQGSSGCGHFYVWNNTLEIPNGQATAAVRVVDRGFPVGTLYLQNNHFIEDSVDFVSPSGVQNLIDDHNLVQTNAEATSAGYSSSQRFVFSPTSTASPTVGAGKDLTSIWPSSFATDDTTDGCLYNANRETVTCPARSQVARPSARGWDVGAYEYGAPRSASAGGA